MSDWVRTSLGEIARFKAGNGFPKKHQGSKTGELPFAKVSDMNTGGNELYLRTAENFISRETAKALKAFIHQPGSTAFAKIGVALTTNRRRLLDREIVLDNNMMSAAPIVNRVDPRFFYYLLSTLDFNSISAGSALPYLTASNLKEIEVCHPDIPEQREIATLLGALDDKIELNRRMSATLEEMARALYRSWFVDFDPVHARSLGQPPAHMDTTTAALFPDSFGPDGLPKGWEAGTLGDVASNIRRQVQPGDIEADTPYIGLEHMPRRSIALSEWGEAGQVGSAKSAMRRGQILFGKLRPYFHKVGIVPTDGICSTDILVIDARADRWREMVLSAVSSDDFVEHANATSSGTRMPRSNWKDMARFDIALPPEPVVEAFSSVVRPMTEKIVAGIHETHTLAALRDTLLPRLMSGELRIRDAEKQVEAVV